MTSPSSPWAKLILHFYYPTEHHFQAINHNITHASPFWKGVIKLTPFFKAGLSYICGNGVHIRFWLDPWSHSRTLAHDFPSLFDSAREQSSTIAENYHAGCWLPSFRSLLSQDRIIQFGLLLCALHSFSPAASEDSISWSLHSSGIFYVKSLYRFMAYTPSPAFPLEVIWSFKIPLKIKIHLWLAAQNKLLTSDNLQHRHIAQSFSCVFCLDSQESSSHIFLKCNHLLPAWDHLRRDFRLPRIPDSIPSLLTSWRRRWISKRLADTWDRIVAALFWLIWLERNNRIFQGSQTSLTDILPRATSLANFWSSSSCP